MNTQRPVAPLSPSFTFPEGPHPTAQSSGVLIMSRTQHILYASPHAKVLLEHLTALPGARPESGSLPSTITSLCQSLLDKLASTSRTNTWEDHHARSVVPIPGGIVLLRGLILPANNARTEYQFLVLLEFVPCELPAPQPVPAEQPRTISRYPALSKRQSAIVEGLIRGLTNKQLASELHISPHTVKEYIRSIMLKVNVTTRAGIVARVTSLSADLSDGAVASFTYGHQE